MNNGAKSKRSPGLQKQTFRLTMLDGITEIYAGLTMAAASLMQIRRLFAPMIVMLVIIGPHLIRRLKQKITYPRLGFVRLPEESPSKTIGGIFAVMIAVAAVVAIGLMVIGKVSNPESWYNAFPLIVSLILIGFFHWIASRSGQRYYYLIAAFSVATAGALALYGFESELIGLKIYLWIMSLLFMIIGIAKLIRFTGHFSKSSGLESENEIQK